MSSRSDRDASRIADPKPRSDGMCANPGCGKPVIVSLVRGVPEGQRIDPFCSTTCAKEFFGVEFQTSVYRGGTGPPPQK